MPIQLRKKAAVVLSEIKEAHGELVANYKSATLPECKLIDAFLLFTMLAGISQLALGVLVRTTPLKTVVGTLFGSVGAFVFAGIPPTTSRC